MLAYAFQSLQSEQFEDINTERFDHVHDLFAAILAKGIAKQLKQGLYREYVVHADELTALRGKINLAETVRLKVTQRQKLTCRYDELSENNLLNQILKTTSLILIRHGQVKPENRAGLKKTMMFFSDVDNIDPTSIRWSSIRFTRSTRTYRMLVTLCQLVLQELLITTEAGEQRLISFMDDRSMAKLYEKFILEYYIKHWPTLHPKASQIKWALDSGEGTLLPTMQSDILLSQDRNVLIIDAKYYSKSTQQNFDRYTVHSGNLYQIFTYVKNKEAELVGKPHQVAGMLLYAKTDQEIQPNAEWKLDGNQISVKTLDLNQDFAQIAAQLDAIAELNFGAPEIGSP